MTILCKILNKLLLHISHEIKYIQHFSSIHKFIGIVFA